MKSPRDRRGKSAKVAREQYHFEDVCVEDELVETRNVVLSEVGGGRYIEEEIRAM